MESQLEIGNTQGWLEQLRLERLTIAALAQKANLDADRQTDIHLCYGDIPEIVFKGFLVTCRDNLDRLIAYCPVIAERICSNAYRLSELRRAFESVINAAAFPETIRQSSGLLWLGDIDHAVPGWVYGLRCVPLVGEWNGEFKTPRPFCPELFEQMARQPQALRWLARHQLSSSRSIPEDPALSVRVREVLACLKSGYSEKEMASELGISRHTIHVHVKRLYRYFDVHSRGELLSLFVKSAPRI